MRVLALFVLLAGCDFDVEDLNEKEKDAYGKKLEFCFEQANRQEGGYTQEAFDRCFYPEVKPETTESSR